MPTINYSGLTVSLYTLHTTSLFLDLEGGQPGQQGAVVAVGEVGVQHGGEGEAGEGDAQAGHQLGHTHRGGHGARAQLNTANTGPRPPLPTEDAAGLAGGWRPHLAPGPHRHHTQQRITTAFEQ